MSHTKPSSFVHLHVHTEFSMLDGLGTVQDYVDRAVQLRMPALAITDHGNVCGTPAFYRACRKAEIEPILGEEFYFTADVEAHKALKGRSVKGEGMEAESAAGLGRYHFGVLARGADGYRVLAELSELAHRNFYNKPMLDRSHLEALGDDARHITVLSGCAASILSKAIQSGDKERIRAEALWWRETFPHLRLELMHHSTSFDRELNMGLVKLGRKYDIPWVVTNDPHYVVKEDHCHHDTLLAVQTASDIDDPNRFRFDGDGYHLRSDKEMRKAFKQYGEEVYGPGMAETLRVAKACKTRIPLWENRTWQIPKFPKTKNARKELRRLAEEGLKQRGLHKKQVYIDRMEEELATIKEVGIEDFLLITRDGIIAAKERGIPVGPGRGSVCGCLVAFLVDIHKIDPIKYDLLFERFLNPARPRMPDIDTDFGQEDREQLFTYTEETYGVENVVHVAAYQSLKLKGMFQQLARAYGVPFTERNKLSKLFSNDDDPEDVLPEELQKAFPDLAAQLTRLMGLKRAISTHPAGVVIADPAIRIREQVPQMWIPNTKRWVGQFDLKAIEDMGLMKQDYLGLKTLDVIASCVRLIERRTGEKLDPDSWDPDREKGDDKVYAMLAEGRTAGVFQMTGPANQRGCRDVQPTCFEDVVSTTALYRTGAISAGFPKIFNANRKQGKKKITYLHPKLKQFLEATWGVVLYQEQVMDFGRHLAGFDMVQVDDIKEAIKHKSGELMQSMKPQFIAGCKTHSGIDPDTALKIWQMIEGYAGYGYNRSHAVAYTFTTYQTARLKCLWGVDFLCALLRHEEDEEKRDTYLREAIEMGGKIKPPCVNRSEERATTEGKGGIRFGLKDIKGIGPAQAAKIIEGRPKGGYRSVDEVAEAVRNVGVMRALLEAGALKKLGEESTAELQEERLRWSFTDPMEPWRRKLSRTVELPRGIQEDVVLAGQIYKITKGKTKTDKPYMTWKVRWSITESFDVRLWSETEKLWETPLGSVVVVAGEWEPKWLNVSVGSNRQVQILHKAKKPKEPTSANA